MPKKSQDLRIANTWHAFFETKDGLAFLPTLITGIIFVFGIHAGVGSDTIALFFKTIKLNNYIGSSPSSIRTQKNKMRKCIDEYGIALMPLIMQLCENKELHLGGDETFFDAAQFLILMELTSGFIITEALVKDRTETTWKKHTDKFFSFFKNIAPFINGAT